ncbi:MAG: PAS domain S-box protein [Deltaproteobacteria bacterium]|nr:PAS domain S-box protein [Deltaproteobacteria bacterium]
MKRTALALVLLLASGLFLNSLAPRLFMGFNYLWGSIPVLITLCYFGVFWGTVAGLVAASWTYVLFGHPYAMVWLTLEPLFIGLLIRRWGARNLVLYNTLYWPLVGMPLLWVFFRFVMHLPWVGTLPAALMFWFIGITNSLCATILMEWLPLAAWAGRPQLRRPLSMRQAIFSLMMAIVLLPALLAMVLNGRATLAEAERTISNRLVEASSNIAARLKELLADQAELISLVAERSQGQGPESLPDTVQGLLAVWLAPPGQGPRLVFQSRPHPPPPPEPGDQSPLQAGGRPGERVLYLRQGKPGGTRLWAALDPRHLFGPLSNQEARDSPAWLSLLGPRGRLLFTNRPDPARREAHEPAPGEIRRPLAGGVYQLLPAMPSYITLWSRVQRSWYGKETPVGPGGAWTLVLEIPFAPYQKLLLERQSLALMLLLGLSLVTLGLATYFSGRFARPITTLAQITTGLASRIQEGGPVEWPASRVHETAVLIANFQQLAAALAARFQEVLGAKETLEERVRARTEDLRQAKEQAELIFRLVPSAIVALSQERRVLIWNDKAAEITGYTAGEMLGRSCDAYCAPACPGENCPLTNPGLALPVMLRECAIRTKDGGERTILKNLDFLRDAEGRVTGVIESFEDITERQAMEERLRHAQKMEAVGTLTGGIAHDFNNLLSIVAGYSELVRGTLAPDDARRGELARVLEACDRAKSLTGNLLAFSRPRKPLLERRDLNQTVRDSVALLRRAGAREHWARFHAGRGAASGESRPGATGPGAHEPGDQRPGRPGVRRGDRGQPGPRPRGSRSRGGRRRRAPGGDPGGGQRPGHGRRHGGAHLRSLLHHQAPGRGHRPGPGHQLRHRAATRRGAAGGERAGAGRRVPGGPALGRGGRRAGSGGLSRARSGLSAGRAGDHPGGRGRGRGADSRPHHSHRGRLPGADRRRRPGGGGAVPGAGGRGGPGAFGRDHAADERARGGPRDTGPPARLAGDLHERLHRVAPGRRGRRGRRGRAPPLAQASGGAGSPGYGAAGVGPGRPRGGPARTQSRLITTAGSGGPGATRVPATPGGRGIRQGNKRSRTSASSALVKGFFRIRLAGGSAA